MTKEQLYQAQEIERQITMYTSVLNGINRLKKCDAFEIKIWERREKNLDKFLGIPSEWMSQEIIDKTFELWENYFKQRIVDFKQEFDAL